MKIALLQCNGITGDIVGNSEKILRAVKNAGAQGANLCITSELAICGVNPRSLIFTDNFVKGCRTALLNMAHKLQGGPAVLIGAPVETANEGTFSNAAVLLQNGNISIISNKILSPNDTDNSYQYFESGTSCGRITIGGWSLGVVLCHDTHQKHSFWKTQHHNIHKPLMELITSGIDGIVHMSATAFVKDAQRHREHILSHVAARHHIHLFSVNAIGGYDNIIYTGQSLAFDPKGVLLARGYAFEEDIVIVDTAVPNELSIMTSPIEEEEYWNALVLGTKDYVTKSGMKNVILGLSGGIDSALVAAIAVEALGKKHVHGISLPSPFTSQRSVEYINKLVNNLDIKLDCIPIKPIMESFKTALNPLLGNILEKEICLTMENIQARIRGNIIMAIANTTDSLVLNTSNKSESFMGYATLYGDTVGALSILGDVPKTQVYKLATWYNKHYPKKAIPQEIIERPPTAELRPNQLDSDSLPPYDKIDSTMENILCVKSNVNQKINICTEEDTIEKIIFHHMNKYEFKRKQCPPALRISTECLGKDWHIPTVSKVRLPE